MQIVIEDTRTGEEILTMGKGAYVPRSNEIIEYDGSRYLVDQVISKIETISMPPFPKSIKTVVVKVIKTG